MKTTIFLILLTAVASELNARCKYNPDFNECGQGEICKRIGLKSVCATKLNIGDACGFPGTSCGPNAICNKRDTFAQRILGKFGKVSYCVELFAGLGERCGLLAGSNNMADELKCQRGFVCVEYATTGKAECVKEKVTTFKLYDASKAASTLTKPVDVSQNPIAKVEVDTPKPAAPVVADDEESVLEEEHTSERQQVPRFPSFGPRMGPLERNLRPEEAAAEDVRYEKWQKEQEEIAQQQPGPLASGMKKFQHSSMG